MKNSSLIARIFLWKRFSAFTYLNSTQFLITLNDATFRFLVAFSLIDKLGNENSSTILFLSGVIFVTPFLLFSMPAGELSDKFPKQKVIAWSLVVEVLAMGYGIFSMHFQSVVNSYVALFVVAMQASIFNPSKYAILPEICHRNDISKVNGIMTLSTYLAIILGSFLASFMTQITGNNYTYVAIFCFLIALLGLFTSLQIQKTEAKNPSKKINPLFLIQVFKSLAKASHYPHLLLTLLASSVFVFTAAYTQLNILPFGIQSLHITDVQAGYIFLAAAFGIGIGSAIVAIISGKNVELGIAILGAFGTAFSYITLYLFSKNIWIATLMVLSLGIYGGLFIVPLDAYIQIASPDKDRGEIVAAGSFLGFIGVLLASLCIGFFSHLLKLTAAEGYLIIGLICLLVATLIMFFLPDYFIRFIAVTFFKCFYSITSHTPPRLGFYDTALIVSKRYSFIHLLSLFQTFPRIAFLKFVKKKPPLLFRPFYHLCHMIPFPINETLDLSMQHIQKIHEKKMPLCLFLEGEFHFQTKISYHELIEKILEQNTQPIIPFRIQKASPMNSTSTLFNFFKVLPVRISAHFGKKEEGKLSFEQTKKLVENLKKSFN